MTRSLIGATVALLTIGSASLPAQQFSVVKPRVAGMDSAMLAQAFTRAGQLVPTNSLLIARDGKLVGERYYRGMSRARTVNVKSVSKSIISALIGIAIAQGELKLEQPVAELLPAYFRNETDARKRGVTVRHLLTMTTGIESTSFDNYGAWVGSRDWVRDALRRPIVCPPGTCMTYSTGNSHILSAILTKTSGLSTRAFANKYLFGPLGTQIGPWTRDPQGVFLGGNEMQLTPRQLLRFGQFYLDSGRVAGKQILPAAWIRDGWGEYATSPWNGHRYGYLWWSRNAGQHKVHFAWGYGGQFVFVVPELKLVVVATSDLTDRRDGDHNRALHNLLDQYIIPAVR